MINNNYKILNNYVFQDITNGSDSALVAFTTLCNLDVSTYDSRHPRPQTNLNFPESGPLESLEFIGVRDSFFHLGVLI